MASDKVLFRHDEPHGPGDLTFVWQCGSNTTYLATSGTDGTVALFNRQGQLQERIILQGLCAGLAWDFDGDILAIITQNTSHITIWDANQRKKQLVDTGLRDSPSCLLWSKKTQILAVATTRGNLALYNHQTSKRIPILGKHSKRIVSGAWSAENILALGSEDKTVSISNDDGDTLRTVTLRDIPSDMHFAEMKTDERVPGESTISMILGKRTLFLYHLPEPDSPTELGFQNRYGNLLQHKWFGDGYILLGFSMGHVVAISTHPREVGQELWQVKNHRDSLSCIAVSKELELVASCGDNNVKIHGMANLQETIKILTLPDQAGLKHVDWSPDGQLLAVTSNQGAISVFVTKLQSIYAISPPRIALLSSLAEVSIYHYTPEKIKTLPIMVSLEIEPTFLAIGSYHLACGMNNRIWFYDLGRSVTDTPIMLGDREYMAEVKQVELNTDYCAVLCGTQVMLHPIEASVSDKSSTIVSSQDRDPKIFPDELQGLHDTIITCLNLTNDFLCFGTDVGHLIHFSLEHWSSVIQYRHSVGIKQIFTDLEGTRVAFIDDHYQGFIYMPCIEETIPIVNMPKQVTGIVWDYSHPSVFVVFDGKICFTYIFVRHSVDGKCVKKVGETKLLTDQIPLMLYDGDLCLYSTGGKLTTISLNSHKFPPSMELEEQLSQLINLQKYQESWDLCKLINKEESWRVLGEKCINDLEIVFAIRVYRKIGDAAMVQTLEEIRFHEDVNLLSGHCAVLLNKQDDAKQLFAKSSQPLEALDLCRDLLQWEQAMALSNNLSQDQMPLIAREYAQQLELNGSYIEALVHYEKSLGEYRDEVDIHGDDPFKEHLRLGKAGIARSTIRCGNFSNGIQIALALSDKTLFLDCAEALEQMNQLSEAAQFYEKGGSFDKACGLYIQLKQWQKVDKILPNVTSLKLHALHAKAKESEGKYRDAINSYLLANDSDSVVRIYIDHLADPHSASEIVLESRSVEGGKMLAKFYQSINDFESALQFLIICGCVSEAFQIAQKYNKMKHYGELLEQHDGAKASDFLALAYYFENEKYTLLTGKYYFLGKEYAKALKLLLKASSFGNEEQQALSLAIDCVASSNDDRLASQLIDFLLGETDGAPKDPKLLFRLYMARKQFKEAAKTSVIISNQEQIAGNYRSAHDLLFSMYQELRRNGLTVGNDMKFNLILLHRYILVRTHVKLGDHQTAAKLLVEVAKNISQFPSHIVPILTSTVIECQRSGMKKSAFNYAVMLMRSEYRDRIDPKYAKKIESIVRKAPKNIKQMSDFEETISNDDDVEMSKRKSTNDSSPCPCCNHDLSNMDVTCSQCKTSLPICIATGQHLTNIYEICQCPECLFPAIKTELIRIIEQTKDCPMCAEEIDINRLEPISDLQAFINEVNAYDRNFPEPPTRHFDTKLFSRLKEKLKSFVSGLVMSEIIPISKTPTQEKVPFVPPKLDWNENGWGPCELPATFKDMPYQPFSKSDRLGKISDWTGSAQTDKKYNNNKYQSQFGSGSQYAYYHDEDETTFHLVDTARVMKPPHQRGRFRGNSRNNRGRGARGGVQVGNMTSLGKMNNNNKARDQRRGNTGRKWGVRGAPPKIRDASVTVRPDWVAIEDMDFPRLQKLMLPGVKEGADIETYGVMEYYDKGFDRVNIKNERPLQGVDRIVHKVTTTDDPVIRKLSKTKGNVYATDSILATIMCCTRSSYSWDVVIEKIGDKLFMDKRDNTEFDLLTVNETAVDPPTEDGMNSPRNLAIEATFINHNFSQQVLKNGPNETKYKFEHPNPFLSEEEEGEVASVGYRYRSWNLNNGIELIARCEHDAVMIAPTGDTQFITIKALNEWDSKLANGVDWRQKLDIQRGAVLANELRNNACKLAKWTVQALLAGSDQIKFGYVSRVHVRDSSKHVILGTQQFKPHEFATQINLSMDNAWGILRCIIDICMKQKDGKYLIMKDPNKPVIRLYDIPDNTFDSDDSDESSEETAFKPLYNYNQAPGVTAAAVKEKK